MQFKAIPWAMNMGQGVILGLHSQAYVVSAPEGIGAGNIITAAHEAEEHLSHGEPVRPEPPPHEARPTTRLELSHLLLRL